MQLGDRLVVLDELVAESVPSAAGDGLTGPHRERAPLRVVSREVEHPAAQLGEVARPVEPAVATRVHQVEGAAGARGDHGNPARHRFLDGLAERLALTRVHEHVEARHRAREVVAAEESGEVRTRQEAFERRPIGTVADDDQPHAGEVCDRPEILDLLLGRESTDVADHGLAVRRDLATPLLAASLGREPLGVDAPTPERQAVDAERLEAIHRRGRRREREIGAAMQLAEVAGQGRRGTGDSVTLGVGGDVGLVHRDRGDADRLCGQHTAPAEHEGRCEVHDVGMVPAQDRREPVRARERHPHVGVARQRHRREEHGLGPVELLVDRTGSRCDHECVVAAPLEVAQHLQQ